MHDYYPLVSLHRLTTLPFATLLDYFSQFGRVSKIRLSRNKKTGKSKHYAFLEFASSEVAQVAATSMDGYMLLGQKLITRVVPKSEIHPDLFKGANRVFTKIPWHKIEEQRHNKVRSPEEEAKRASRQLRREKKRQRETAQAGIDYVYEEEEEEEVQPDSIIKSAPKETKQKPGKGIAKTRKTKPPSTRKA